MQNLAQHFAYKMHILNKEPNYEALLPNFGWALIKAIKKTFQVSTQHAVEPPDQFYMHNILKSANPALNIPRRNEAVATDTVFSNTPAIDNGSTCAQILWNMRP